MTDQQGPIEVVAFEAANSRVYLEAVFAAWTQGQCVMALPEGAGRRTVPGTKVLERRTFESDPGWFDAALPECRNDEPALIAFSSGTTGRPKAILISHRALQDVVARINAAMGIDETIREYLGVPVTYSFGFGRVRAVAAAGGKAFLPEHGFDPSEIGRMLASGDINAVSAVPTLWRILLANKSVVSQEAAKNLRWIEIGSQWMSGAEKLALRELFPNARIVQHYGLTEASRTALLDVSEAPEDRLESVGRAEGDVEIGIDDDGCIRTRGPHLASGLVSGAGVKPVADDDGWLTTSDHGRLEDGWLYYEGRADELINSGGLKIDPTAFEQSVNSALGVPGAVAAGRLQDPLRGEKVLVVLRQDAGLEVAQVESAIQEQAARIGLTGNGSFELREVAEIPLTATGKVKRGELPELVAVTAVPLPSAAVATGTSKASELKSLWSEILGVEDVPTDKSFYDIGGDSLSALTAIMRMESLGIEAETARGIFEGKTIDEMVGGGEPVSTEATEPVSKPEPVAEIPEQSSQGQLGELQGLWSDLLGLDNVPTDKSFYDLGGDSLSALTAIMRMESLGIEAETARGIFEGKTIAEMASGTVEPTAFSNSKAADLQALWSEILGLDNVPTDKSFYDLGGDSLSALTAIMRMESLGIEAETARGIFEGKTIAEMSDVVADDAPAEVPSSAPPAKSKTEDLKALWSEILGVEDVPTDKSFYDLGGDSLSALTAIMRMESLGIEAETARGIFEGKTIDALVGEPEPVVAETVVQPTPEAAPVVAPPEVSLLTLAESVNTIHAARGVLVLWVVLVHWLPALLERIDPELIWLYTAGIPAWRMGTPGFAMVFGMGVGALGIHHYISNRSMFMTSNRFNTKLIVSGVLILGLAKLGVAVAEGSLGDRIVMSGLLYSAISFYALAMLTLPVIVWLLTRGRNRLLTIFAVGAGSAALHLILHASFAHYQPPAAIETVKLLLTAKYGFFRMLSFVMVGVAIGWLFRRHRESPDILRDLTLYGLVVLTLGAVGTVQAVSEGAAANAFGRTYLWHLSVYAGLVTLVLAGFAWLNASGGPRSQLGKQFNAFFMASGILALPIFVGHEIVFAIKQVFDAFNVPDAISLIIVLGSFLVAMVLAYKKLWRLVVR